MDKKARWALTDRCSQWSLHAKSACMYKEMFTHNKKPGITWYGDNNNHRYETTITTVWLSFWPPTRFSVELLFASGFVCACLLFSVGWHRYTYRQSMWAERERRKSHSKVQPISVTPAALSAPLRSPLRSRSALRSRSIVFLPCPLHPIFGPLCSRSAHMLCSPSPCSTVILMCLW